MKTTKRTAQPYTARECPICGRWVYIGVSGRGHADYRHWEREHATPEELAPDVVGFPFFPWNEEAVEVR